jgi:hypothetical protein
MRRVLFFERSLPAYETDDLYLLQTNSHQIQMTRLYSSIRMLNWGDPGGIESSSIESPDHRLATANYTQTAQFLVHVRMFRAVDTFKRSNRFVPRE